MKAADIFKEIDANFGSKLKGNGFALYKGKSYLKVIDGVVQIMKASCHKHDVHLWYACYPLCEKNIWFGAATISTSGRLPQESNGLKISNQESFKNVIPTLSTIFDKILIQFKKCSSLQLLESSIKENDLVIPGFTKAYCLAQLGSYKEANEYLLQVINSNLSESYKESANELIESIQNGDITNLLENNSKANIKKLGLSKYV